MANVNCAQYSASKEVCNGHSSCVHDNRRSCVSLGYDPPIDDRDDDEDATDTWLLIPNESMGRRVEHPSKQREAPKIPQKIMEERPHSHRHATSPAPSPNSLAMGTKPVTTHETPPSATANRSSNGRYVTHRDTKLWGILLFFVILAIALYIAYIL